MKLLMRMILMWIFSVPIWAESWQMTNVQYLYGNDFSRLVGEKQVTGGSMETITIEHAGGWEYGKNFFFLDLTSADFVSGKKYAAYAEWAPKVSLSSLSDKELEWGIVKDVFIAGEINQGDDFRAINLGLAAELAFEGFSFFDVNLFTRKDNYNKRTLQLTLAWKSSFSLLDLPMIFEGFFDYYGTDYGTEVLTQPRLLLEGKAIAHSLQTLHAGIELYYYRSSATPWRGHVNEAVPQVMIKWVW